NDIEGKKEYYNIECCMQTNPDEEWESGVWSLGERSELSSPDLSAVHTPEL
ncbi:hypothetical protein NHX12_032353, partial [Muraenolepis orangiensis]